MKVLIRAMAIIVISLTIILSIGFIALEHGITISQLSISNTKINNAHLTLDDKLKLEIEQITVQPTKGKASKKPFDGAKPSYVRDALRIVNLIEKWFFSINIKEISVGSLNASFQFHEKEGGQLTVNSPQFETTANIQIDGEFLLVDIENIRSKEYKSHAQGKARIDAANRKLTATVEAMIAETVPLQLEVKADLEQLSFSGQGTQAVASIVPVVELFNLDPDVTPWINDYLTASQISLKSVSGTIPYDNPTSILQTLHAVAMIEDTEYTFAQGLKPIKATETDIEFAKGILNIKPRDASFYEQDVGNSELDINFNNNPFILTAYIRTKAQASGGVLSLLKFYGIPFPLEQKEGLIDTDLTLTVNLSTIDINASGTFKADNSAFEFDQQRIDVEHLDISLNDSALLIHKLDVSKKGLFSARTTGEVDTAKGQGTLRTNIDKFNYQSAHTALVLDNPDSAPLLVNYHMSPDGDSISVGESAWMTGGASINIGKFTTPFNHATVSGTLPPTSVAISPWIKAKVSGAFNREPPYANLDVLLYDLNYGDFRVGQSEFNIALVIGDKISVKSQKSAKFHIGKSTLNLKPTHLSYASNNLKIHQSGMVYAGQVFSDIKGQLDFNTQTGKLTLDKLKIIDNSGVKLLAVDKPVAVNLSLNKDMTSIKIPMLDFSFSEQAQKGWSLSLKKLGELNKHSPLMQEYKLQKGELLLSSKDGLLPWDFNGKLTYPLALLIDGDSPVHDYNFNGSYDGKITIVDINEKIHVKLAEKLSINSSDIGYNLPALIKLIKEQPKDGETEKKADKKKGTSKNKKTQANKSKTADNTALSLSLDAENSFVYLSDKSRILADNIKLSLDQGIITSDLKHGNGFASLQIKDDKISLVGNKFDKVFLNGLLTTSEFSDARLEFELSGSVDDIDAVITIHDATIQGLGPISKVLAFADTIPALVTFSLPSFHSDGLHADTITAAVNIQHGLIKLKSAELDSKELDIRGEGNANINDDTIDITLNLITGAKKHIGRIPLLGYILSGGEKKASITITVKGDLKDPQIAHTAFKEVASYPLQLLKRTIILPDHLVKKVRKETSGEEKNDPSEPAQSSPDTGEK